MVDRPGSRNRVLLFNAAFMVTVLAIAIALTLIGRQAAMAEPAVGEPLWFIYLLTHYPDRMTSFATVTVGIIVAVTYLATRGGRRWRRARVWRVLRVVFARRYLTHRSHGLDVIFFFANAKVFVVLFGWLILSGSVFATLGYDALVSLFGKPEKSSMSPATISWIGAVAFYLTYEFGYWLDHYLSHRIPVLWEFHRVHHEAEVLSPLTTFRVHPVDTVVFYNILAIAQGFTSAIVHFSFGLHFGEGNFAGLTIIFGVASYLLLQLHHSQLWLPLTGVLGRIFISPAHHQIHHSSNPLHFDKNMGSCLAIFDWLFGTLHLPNRQREHLVLGVVPAVGERHDPHSLEGALIAPFKRGLERVTDHASADAPEQVALPSL